MNLNNASFNTKSRAYTLIELLTVMVILGILVGIAYISVSSIQAKARDTQRKSDITQIARAVEMFAANNAHYPIYDESDEDAIRYYDSSDNWSSQWGYSFLRSYLVPKYIKRLPTDPKGRRYPYNANYQYSTNVEDEEYPINSKEAQNYVVYAFRLENTNDPQTCGTRTAPKHVFTLYGYDEFGSGFDKCFEYSTDAYKNSFGVNGN